MNDTLSPLQQFAKRFLLGRMNWYAVPRLPTAVTNFGNIISLVLYRKDQFQVELFIVPDAPSSFTEHTHPDVDVVEFGLTGIAELNINGLPSCTEADVDMWLKGDRPTVPIAIPPGTLHSGAGHTPYAFLSIQHWLNGITPTSVGLNWRGQAASLEQAQLWLQEQSVDRIYTL